jgi:predicted nucleic acid-binding protein
VLAVADTSALVSLGTAVECVPDPLGLLLDTGEVAVPRQVADELDGIAAYDDAHADAARAVLDRLDEIDVHEDVAPDASFPLDEGENTAVVLANDLAADAFLCDEHNAIALVHASLERSRLRTTPTLIWAFIAEGTMTRAEGEETLEAIGRARSWEANRYVQRVMERFK